MMFLWEKKASFIKGLLFLFYSICIGWITNLGFYPKTDFWSLDNWHYFFCYLVFLFVVIEKIISAINEKTCNELERERNYYRNLSLKTQKNVQATLDLMLENIGKELEFDLQKEKIDRITVYGLNSNEESFFTVSRFSENASFQKIDVSKTYSVKKGCINIGFNEGSYFCNDSFPCFKTERKKYVAYVSKEFNYKSREVYRFSMQSRLYAVQRIKKDGKNYGVVVLESLDPDRFDKSSVMKVLKRLSDDISYLLRDLAKQVEGVDIIYENTNNS